MKKEMALILAGGRGTRMNILCQNRPKPLLPVAGNFRVIDFTLSNCINSKIGSIAVVVDHLREKVVDYTSEWHYRNGGDSRRQILAPQSGSYRGTADAVYRNLDILKQSEAEKVLILSGDHIYKMDYRKMMAFHDQMKAEVTVGVIRVPVEESHRFGTVSINAENRILEFKEKSASSWSNLASMGIYIFSREMLMKRLEEDARNPDSIHDFGYSLLPQMVKNDRVFAYQFNQYWRDIGTVEAYYEANMELLESSPGFTLDSRWPVLSQNIDMPENLKNPGGEVVNSLVSPGCVIKGRVENSILSTGVYVAEHALVKNSLMMAGVSIGDHSTVDKCILDEGVNIGNFCYLGPEGNNSAKTPEIIVLGGEVRVPDTTAIGRKCPVVSG
jgi:glucose-1-phosphate adenylyltransferase